MKEQSHKDIERVGELTRQRDSRDGADHVQTHFHAAASVIRPRFRKSRDTVIAVAEQFDAEAMMLGRQCVEANAMENRIREFPFKSLIELRKSRGNLGLNFSISEETRFSEESR